MRTNPIFEAHAIAEVVFILEFDQPFSKEQLESVLELKDSLKDDLPVIQRRESITSKIEIKDGRATTSTDDQAPVIAGVTFQHSRNDSTQDWVLRIEGNFVAVNCTEYAGWTRTWERARRYLCFVMPKVLVSGNAVNKIALKYLDHFTYDGDPAAYSASELFNNDSGYLTRKCFQVGQWWHVHQGWFDDVSEPLGCRCLNVLNISTSQGDKDNVHTTAIDAHLQLQVGEKSPEINSVESLLATENGTQAYLDQAMNLLHMKNKEIMVNLLQSEMAKRIGLA